MSIPTDCFYIILPFLTPRDLYTVSLLDSTTHNIAEGFLDPSVNDNKALIKACKSSDESLVVRLLRDSRVDPNAQTGSVMAIAVERGCYNIVEALLNDVRLIPDSNSLEAAAYHRQFDIFNLLLDDGRYDFNMPVDKGKYKNTKWIMRAIWEARRYDIIERLADNPKVRPLMDSKYLKSLSTVRRGTASCRAKNRWR